MEESLKWNNDILPLINRMNEHQNNSYHKWKVQRFPGYFIDVVTSWVNSNKFVSSDFKE